MNITEVSSKIVELNIYQKTNEDSIHKIYWKKAIYIKLEMLY